MHHTDRCLLSLVASWGFHSLPGAVNLQAMRRQRGVCCSLLAKPQPDALKTGRRQHLYCPHGQRRTQPDGSQMVRQHRTAARASHAAAKEPSRQEPAGMAYMLSRSHVARDEAQHCILIQSGGSILGSATGVQHPPDSCLRSLTPPLPLSPAMRTEMVRDPCLQPDDARQVSMRTC